MASKKQIADGLASILETLARSPKLLTQKVKALLSDLMSAASDFIKRPDPVAPPTPDQQETIDLLWHVSGGNPQSFAENAASFPDPDLEEYLRQPGAMESVVAKMSEQPPAPPAEIGEHGINSSNVYGLQYDGKNLRVKYNGSKVKNQGPVYEYSNVPQDVVDMIARGDLPPETTGSNQWHAWERGRTPSVGATAIKLLNKGPFNYRKISD